MRRVRASISIMLMLAICLSGCQEARPVIAVPQLTPKTSPVIRPNPEGDAELLLPVLTVQPPPPVDTMSRQWLAVYGLIYDPLVRLDEAGRPTPNMCESFTVAPDGKTWTFRLRLGIAFHDGRPLNAQAIVDSYARVRSGTNPYSSVLSKIERVKAEDELVLTVVSKEPGMDALYAMCAPVLGEDGGVLPSGTGAYRVTGFMDGCLLLESNEDGWLRAPSIKYAHTVGVAGEEAALGRISLGELTVAPLFRVSPGAVDRSMVSTVVINTRQYEFIAPNMRADSPASDVRIRKAIASLLDVSAVARLVHVGGALITDLPILPGSYLLNPQLEGVRATGEEAQRLLAEAGYSQARPLRLKLLANTETETAPRADMAKAIADMLAPFHIEVEVSVKPFAEVKKDLTSGQFDLALLGVTLPFEPDLRPLLAEKGVNNVTGSKDVLLGELLDAASAAADEETRVKAWSALEKRLIEELPIIGLFFHTGTLAYSPALSGVEGAIEPDLYRGASLWKME